MSFTKRYKEIIMFIFIIVICIINYTNAYAAPDIEYNEFTPINIQKTSNGANVEINSSETNGYELDVKMSTKGLNKGYYTAYLYENQSNDWSSYEAIGFHIINDSDSPIRINMNLKESEEKVLSPSDESIILIKKDSSEKMEKLKPSYGTVELPKQFEGTIYIPFNSLIEKDSLSKNKTKEILRISSWGIIATLPENEESNFKLSNFALIKKGSKIATYFDSNLSIKGNSIVQIPVEGESISEYKVEANNKNIQFKLMNSLDGITISDDGRFTVTTDVEEQKVQICAVIDDRVSETMEIQLVKSWTLSAQEVDGTSKSIPKSDEVKKLMSSGEKKISTDNALVLIRICSVLIAIGVGALYWKWKNNDNKLQ